VSHNPLASFDIGYGLSRLFRRTERWSDAVGINRSLLGLCKDLFEKDHPMALFIDADLVVAKANAGGADRESAVAGVAHIWKSLSFSRPQDERWLMAFVREYGPLFREITSDEAIRRQIVSDLSKATASEIRPEDVLESMIRETTMTAAGVHGWYVGRDWLTANGPNVASDMRKDFPGLNDTGPSRDQAISDAATFFSKATYQIAIGLWHRVKQSQPWLDDVEPRRYFVRGAIFGLSIGFNELLNDPKSA